MLQVLADLATGLGSRQRAAGNRGGAPGKIGRPISLRDGHLRRLERTIRQRRRVLARDVRLKKMSALGERADKNRVGSLVMGEVAWRADSVFWERVHGYSTRRSVPPQHLPSQIRC